MWCSEAFEYSALTATLALCTDLCVPASLQTGTQDTHRTQRATGRQCVCVTVHVLQGTLCKIENFALIVDVASYPKYKMFSNKVEI